MAPVAVNEDYYLILQVERPATTRDITSAYRRLARELHPDWNSKPDATVAFQRLGQAYETLKDEQKRREYDTAFPFPKWETSSNSTSVPRAEASSEVAQIAVIQKCKQDRDSQWQTRKRILESSIFEKERVLRRLEQGIKILADIAAAEAAADAQKNSWTAWFRPSSYGKKEDSEEEKARKDRDRQERRLEQDMKERRLDDQKADLKKIQSQLQTAQTEFDDANAADDVKVRLLQARIWQREYLERQRRETAEQERQEALLREQRQREQAAADARRREMAEMHAAQQRRREEEEIRRRQDAARHRRQESHHTPGEPEFSNTSRSSCSHNGWWPKVQGRRACPKCCDMWTYLLQCPSCETMACPKCQGLLRRRTRSSRFT